MDGSTTRARFRRPWCERCRRGATGCSGRAISRPSVHVRPGRPVVVGHADAPADDCSQLLWGEGSLPMTAIVQSLLDNDYDGLFEIDIWSRDLWRSNYTDVLAHCRDQFVRELAIRR